MGFLTPNEDENSTENQEPVANKKIYQSSERSLKSWKFTSESADFMSCHNRAGRKMKVSIL